MRVRGQRRGRGGRGVVALAGVAWGRGIRGRRGGGEGEVKVKVRGGRWRDRKAGGESRDGEGCGGEGGGREGLARRGSRGGAWVRWGGGEEREEDGGGGVGGREGPV